jgi:hypothetical protein
MTSLTKNKSIDELFTLLSESSRMERICQADRDAILIAIFRKQQETIEKNQKTIKEQKELIENLWAWAEEKDEQMFPQYSDEDEELRLRAYREWEEGGRQSTLKREIMRQRRDVSKAIHPNILIIVTLNFAMNIVEKERDLHIFMKPTDRDTTH